MHFKLKKVKGRRYKYIVRSVRMPNGDIKKIEVNLAKRSSKELNKILDDKEIDFYTNYMLDNYKINYLFNEDEFRKIEEIKINYKKILRKLDKKSLRDLLDRFTVNFTYESNAIEGNSLTLKDVEIVLFENISIKGKELREIYETRNSRKVVELIMKNKFSISHEDIIKVHKFLMEDIDDRLGYKKIPNVILGRKIVTTAPEKVYEEMDKLISWYRENKERLHPIEIASIFHGRFEHIHPFLDGNGRVGRFLINVILTENKYPPLIIRKSQRVKYLKALEQFDYGRTEQLRLFILQKFKDTYRKFFEVYVKYL